MSFKIGDEVKLIVNNPYGACLMAGDIGIIKGEVKNDYAIEFNFDFTDMYDCYGLVPSKHGWFVNEKDLALVNNSPIKEDKIDELIKSMKEVYLKINATDVNSINIDKLKKLRDFSKGYALDIQELIYGFEETKQK